MNDILLWLDTSLFAKAAFVTIALFFAMVALSKTLIDIRRSRVEEQKVHLELDILRSKLERSVYRANEDLLRDPKNFADVNHLILDSAKQNDEDTAKQKNFFEGMGIDASDIKVEPRTAFVLTPHHKMFEETYRQIYGVLSDTGFAVKRGDEDFVSSSILTHVIKSILKADVIVANIDGRNPNVFYELGIAQTMGKKVIIVSSEANEIPFDLSSQRLVLWDDKTELKQGMLKAIARLTVDYR